MIHQKIRKKKHNTCCGQQWYFRKVIRFSPEEIDDWHRDERESVQGKWGLFAVLMLCLAFVVSLLFVLIGWLMGNFALGFLVGICSQPIMMIPSLIFCGVRGWQKVSEEENRLKRIRSEILEEHDLRCSVDQLYFPISGEPNSNYLNPEKLLVLSRE